MRTDIEHPATNGFISVMTQRGETHISYYVAPGSMFGILDNTRETRRFLRTALKRMERTRRRNGQPKSGEGR